MYTSAVLSELSISKKQMKQMKLNRIVHEREETIINNKSSQGKKRNYTTRVTDHADDTSITSDAERHAETMLQNLIKEKKLLNQWKRERFLKKKTDFIIRSQARVFRNGEKQYIINDQPDESVTINLFKHAGCNDECQRDDHTDYLLDLLDD